MTGNHAYTGGIANARRTRLGAGWVPSHLADPLEYEVTNGPVANERRSQAEDEAEGTES
ncbi:hypothetical protein ABZ403_05535 [Micromonospora zamorensis]|uniref:hypothetical protein n=1 Tax=Micromonospora zamorensis TaxID=709883 RepID=UPI0033EBAE11